MAPHRKSSLYGRGIAGFDEFIIPKKSHITLRSCLLALCFDPTTLFEIAVFLKAIYFIKGERGNLRVIINKTNKCVCMEIDNRPFYSCVLSYLAMTASEAGSGGDLALTQTSLQFSCKCQLVSIRTT